ncbi:uncharacterized protein C2845_PM05G07530 [Panicum miliaceum]|uniref:Uncharacterized protein n=1 Tax=Panicum miliaceum TaxID=4540 RepID=A0A3L6SUA2_PANMI|nr:uncharacterized protein C2845_PM05G07530 [Panicum miliaceum]
MNEVSVLCSLPAKAKKVAVLCCAVLSEGVPSSFNKMHGCEWMTNNNAGPNKNVPRCEAYAVAEIARLRRFVVPLRVLAFTATAHAINGFGPSIPDLTDQAKPPVSSWTSAAHPPRHHRHSLLLPSRSSSSSAPPMAAHAGTLAPPLPLRLPPRPLPRPRLVTPASSSSSSSPLRARRLGVARAASGGDGGPPAEGDKERKGPSLPALSEIRWGELLSPEPANATAVVLTGALAWAGASLLLQLLLIFATIFAAAVKYSFVAAILLFILIALL